MLALSKSSFFFVTYQFDSSIVISTILSKVSSYSLASTNVSHVLLSEKYNRMLVYSLNVEFSYSPMIYG